MRYTFKNIEIHFRNANIAIKRNMRKIYLQQISGLVNASFSAVS